MTTHEPCEPLPNWPESHVSVKLTDASALECVKVTVHGVEHYLHATTARELEQMLTRELITYNKQVKQLNRASGTRFPLV
jgi:hypothetical protein